MGGGGWLWAVGPHTHVRDHPQLLNVGGLCVQELPHRFLLVALPPGQLLWEGQGVAQEPRACRGGPEGAG